MKNLFNTMCEQLAAGKPVALVTIIAGSGSTPRGSGARMLVGHEGRLCGTIGGGAIEHRAEALATEAIDAGLSYTKSFALRPGEVEDLGMICGGAVNVYIQFIAPKPDSVEFARRVSGMFSLNEDIWLMIDITDSSEWEMALYARASGLFTLGHGSFFERLDRCAMASLLVYSATERDIDGRRIYSELLASAGRAVIFGGGHIGQELVPVLAHLDFRCVVYDDRDNFTRPGLFPKAHGIIRGSFSDIGSHIELTKDDYIIVATRGHAGDYEVLSHVLKGDAAYFGCIGSRKKVAEVSRRLRGEGITQEAIDKVHMPIGLPIQAKTPAEIAVSIAAELVNARAAKTAEG